VAHALILAWLLRLSRLSLVVASAWPAMRAARVDVIQALRAD
jgi:ABC-type lipoprotein release transport system permease subunit